MLIELKILYIKKTKNWEVIYIKANNKTEMRNFINIIQSLNKNLTKHFS